MKRIVLVSIVAAAAALFGIINPTSAETTVPIEDLALVSETPTATDPLDPEVDPEPYPRLQYPRLQHPRLQHPRLQHPRLHYPRLQHPRLQYPRLQYPRLQYPRLQYPHTHRY